MELLDYIKEERLYNMLDDGYYSRKMVMVVASGDVTEEGHLDGMAIRDMNQMTLVEVE
jgi:hypothetical protein